MDGKNLILGRYFPEYGTIDRQGGGVGTGVPDRE